MNSQTLLPNGSSLLEKQLSHTFSCINAIPVPIHLLWSAEHCPESLLPWLAWSLSIEEWDDEWNEKSKRQAILNSIHIHKHKGTILAIKKVISQRELGEVVIDEGGKKKHNRDIRLRNGFHKRGSLNNWAEYQIIFIEKPISKSKAERFLLEVQQYAPARCFLSGLVNQKNLIKHNGRLTIRNGEFNRGERWSVRQKIQ